MSQHQFSCTLKTELEVRAIILDLDPAFKIEQLKGHNFLVVSLHHGKKLSPVAISATVAPEGSPLYLRRNVLRDGNRCSMRGFLYDEVNFIWLLKADVAKILFSGSNRAFGGRSKSQEDLKVCADVLCQIYRAMKKYYAKLLVETGNVHILMINGNTSETNLDKEQIVWGLRMTLRQRNWVMRNAGYYLFDERQNTFASSKHFGSHQTKMAFQEIRNMFAIRSLQFGLQQIPDNQLVAIRIPLDYTFMAASRFQGLRRVVNVLYLREEKEGKQYIALPEHFTGLFSNSSLFGINFRMYTVAEPLPNLDDDEANEYLEAISGHAHVSNTVDLYYLSGITTPTKFRLTEDSRLQKHGRPYVFRTRD